MLCVALVSGTKVASAQASDSFGGMLFFSSGYLSFDQKKLSPGLGEKRPDPLRGTAVVLDGRAISAGGGVRDTLQLGGLRFSLASSFFLVQGLKARIGAPAAGFEAEARDTWGGIIEGAVGRQFRVGWFYPFADIRVLVLGVSSPVELRSSVGSLGLTHYEDYSLDLGPRLGVWLPFASTGFAELSAHAGLFGAERFGANLGVGFFLPFSSDEHGVRR